MPTRPHRPRRLPPCLSPLWWAQAVLSLVLPDVAEAQTEPNTAANGVLLPPQDYDPAAARNVDRAESAVVPATPAISGLTPTDRTHRH